MSIPVIDIFAGPGGLGEGFSSVFDKNGNRVYYGRTKKENDGYYYVTGLKSGKEYTFVFTENKEYGKRKEKVEIPETEKFMEIERDFLIAKKSSNSATTGR